MDFLQLVKKNRSYRGFDERVKVKREELERLVECARFCPSSINNQALKFYLSCTDETNALIQPLTGWARRLKTIQLPHPGHCPTGFVVICYDSNIPGGAARYAKDVGIVAQTMLLGAVDMGLGGCMIGNFVPERISAALELPVNLEPVLILAVGKPDETVVLTDAENGEVGYYRDDAGRHYVPKRPLNELILNPAGGDGSRADG